MFIFFLFKVIRCIVFFFFFSSRRRHTICLSDWSSDVCSSDLPFGLEINNALLLTHRSASPALPKQCTTSCAHGSLHFFGPGAWLVAIGQPTEEWRALGESNPSCKNENLES